MTGNIAVWTAARQGRYDEAEPKIIERLRPAYGRMYNFDDAQPGNIRLIAMDIHPTMSNRLRLGLHRRRRCGRYGSYLGDSRNLARRHLE